MPFEIGTSDDVVFLAVVVASSILLFVGILERRRHRRALAAVPLRVSVNGSRGKSTVARLLTGALAAGDHRPLGKTTGTEARLVHGWSGEEEPVHRRPEGPNIGENRALVRRAVELDADTIVAECMAVNPDYQLTFHGPMLDVNVYVVTNALDDHLDQMGPTAQDVAEVFAASVPRDGVVVTVPGHHVEVLRAAAEERGSTLLLADVDAVPPAWLREFDHLVLDEHVALTLAVTRHLGVSDEAALDGMRAAPPDPFATRLVPVGDPTDPALFVNAFPANDPSSTLAVWQHVLDQGHDPDRLVVIMNCREDRMVRNQQFADEVLPNLPIDTLVVTGSGTRAVTAAAGDGRIAVREVLDLTGADGEAVAAALDDRLHGRVVLGVGNLVGRGVEILDALQRRAVRGDVQPAGPTEHGGTA